MTLAIEDIERQMLVEDDDGLSSEGEQSHGMDTEDEIDDVEWPSDDKLINDFDNWKLGPDINL